MIKKDRSSFVNKTYLIENDASILPTTSAIATELFPILVAELSDSLLQTVKQVRLETLATVLPLPITFESRRRKLQRFLKLPSLTFETLWFPIFSQWVKAAYEQTQLLYLAIDRTSWIGINLLMVSLIVDKRAIPLYCQRLNKVGSSNLSEQQAVILGDREFCSVKLGHWLTQQPQQIWFCLRLRRNEQVELEEHL